MRTVFFVDDEPWSAVDAQQSIRWSDYGFAVSRYLSNPVLARELICTEQPTLCITDIRMPVLSGLELVRSCRDVGSSTKFILLSGYSEFEYAREALRLGVLDYWLKPLDPNEVHRKLELISTLLVKESYYESSVENDDYFQAIITYIRENCHERIQLTDLARTFGFNKNYLCSMFTDRIGVTFVQYLTDIRIQKACNLLHNSTYSIEEIGRLCGIPDAAYFNKVFKKSTGLTPGKYRKNKSDCNNT